MRKDAVLSCILVAALCLGAAPAAFALGDRPVVVDIQPIPMPPAAGIAKRCVHHVTQLADEAERFNKNTAMRCVALIKRLHEAGRKRAAFRVAKRCIRRINRHSNHKARLIRRICAKCVNRLEALGEPELAMRVKHACGKQIMRVHDSQKRAVAEIQNALGLFIIPPPPPIPLHQPVD